MSGHIVTRKSNRRCSLEALWLSALLVLAASGCALAQTYPSKPITFVVPYAPGGGGDIVARTIGQPLSRALKEQVVIDNRAGVGGNLGAALAARAAPDGYTWLLATNTHAVNASLYRKVPFDLTKDFSPVTQLSTTPLVLIVHPSIPAPTVQALVALAGKLPGQLNYASGGNGSSPHLAAELFRSAAKINIVHVPYKGVAQGMTDLLSGQVHLMFTNLSSASAHITSGRLRPLAVTSAQRSRAAPNVPTLIESGLRDVEMTSWNALLVPAKTPADIIALLHKEVVKVLNDAEVKSRFASLGVEPVSSSPQELEAFIRAELVRWAKVVKESGATIE